jgi:hypothetical protein
LDLSSGNILAMKISLESVEIPIVSFSILERTLFFQDAHLYLI